MMAFQRQVRRGLGNAALTTTALLAGFVALGGCAEPGHSGGSPADTEDDGEAESAGGTTTTGDDGAGETQGSTEDSAGSTGAEDQPALEIVAQFDPAMWQLPEGLALLGEDAFVAFAPSGQVYRVDTTGAEAPAPYASVPPLPPNEAFITGIAFDDQDRLLVALPSFAADPPTGIYRAPAGGGEATLFAAHEAMMFPSAIRQHPDGDLFVTDSFTATVFRITPEGEATVWVTDPMLSGDKTLCGFDDALFDIGANGLVVTHDRILVAVTHQGQLLEIPIEDDASAGAIEVLAGPDCNALGGIDGMDLAPDGSIYAALNAQRRIVRISPEGEIDTISEDPSLDAPATVRIGTADGDPALYWTNFALDTALAGLEAAPSLARLAPMDW
jgi:sugar lactone lactonase YvrE